jgi:hypothetical protein
MDENEEYTELHTIRDITDNDSSFFQIVRQLDPSTRNHLVAAHLRNTNLAYQLLRTSLSRNTVVMNVPISSLIEAQGTFLDPVSVSPSSSQIRSATEILTAIPTDTRCSICQEDITGTHLRIRHCSHCFHNTCIQQWFTMNPRCPVCRHDIRDLQPTELSSSNDSSVHSDDE